jgi:hypothetical protein
VERAKAMLYAVSRLAGFALSVGLAPTADAVSDDALIERFIVGGTSGLSTATRRTLRANLRAVARARAAAPGAVGLPRERAKAPYGANEVARYLALAAAQPTLARRMRSLGLIALGAGAGLMGTDLRSVRGRDVVVRSGGLLVVVGGSRSRVVPVLARYHGVLRASAGFADEGYVIGSNNTFRHNVTTPLVSSLAGGVDLARLDTGRLRASWLRECAETIGLSSFLAAAGITCSQRLGDIAARVTPRSEAEVVALFDLSPLHRGATPSERAAHDARAAELASYKFSALCAPDADGYQRVMCPAAAGKVRCPHKPTSLRLSFNRPSVQGAPEELPRCCAQQSITVPPQVNEKTRQKHDYAGPAHRASYNRRTAAERTYASLADPSIGGIRRGWCRLFGLAKNTLMYALAVAVRNVRIVESFERRRDKEARAAAIGPTRHRRRRHEAKSPAPPEQPETEAPLTPD